MESKPPLRCSVCDSTCTDEEEAIGWNSRMALS
jgi:hypothetical protein